MIYICISIFNFYVTILWNKRHFTFYFTILNQYSFKTIKGDFINNTQASNLIDVFSLDTNDGLKVPALIGRNIKLYQNETLEPNQYHVVYHNISDNQLNRQVIMNKDNLPVIITIPENHTDLIASGNDAIIYKKAREPLKPELDIESLGTRDIQPPKVSITDKLQNIPDTFSKEEKAIINFTRGRYAFSLTTSLPYKDSTDNYIVERDNKFYLLPSAEYKEKSNRRFTIQPISKEEAFTKYSKSKFVAVYNSLESAQRAREKIRIFDQQDYELMNE